MNIIHRTSLVLLLFFLVACTIEPDATETVQENKPEKITSLAHTSNALGFSMLKYAERDDVGNVFLSPLSSFIALAIVMEGADGETKKEIETLLSLDVMDQDERREAITETLDMLERNEDDLTVKIANSLWLNEQYHFKPSFEEMMHTHYDAEIFEISVKKMNDWVREATKDKIIEIVESPLKEEIVLYLLQTVYFNGSWQYSFTEDTNEERIFQTEKEDVTIPFMTLEEELHYVETANYEAVKIPYANGKMSMYVFLPKDDLSFDEIVDDWMYQSWDDIESNFIKKRGTVILPQFQLQYEVDLKRVLKKLGMERAFIKDQAELPHLIEEKIPLSIDEVKQKTFVEVDEKGTEAAGATSVGITTTSAPLEDDTFYMEVNRPFIMTITDDTTKTHLFVGHIVHPEQTVNSP